ncbi:MAG TPA: hypothetical protein PLN21_22460 [Gemmatales bacterium]|nr:hypothetical protein [Gemmatales bacterium]
MISKPSNSIFWFFIVAAGLFVGSKSLFPQSGCSCLSGRCRVPTATVPQVDDTLTNEQVAQKE